jgi:hypothetical protein
MVLWLQAFKPFVADDPQYLQPLVSEQTKLDEAIQWRGSGTLVPISYKKEGGCLCATYGSKRILGKCQKDDTACAVLYRRPTCHAAADLAWQVQA